MRRESPPASGGPEVRLCGKRTFESESQARAARSSLLQMIRKFGHIRGETWTRRDVKRLNVYPCHRCGGWHLGKKPKHNWRLLRKLRSQRWDREQLLEIENFVGVR